MHVWTDYTLISFTWLSSLIIGSVSKQKEILNKNLHNKSKIPDPNRSTAKSPGTNDKEIEYNQISN